MRQSIDQSARSDAPPLPPRRWLSWLANERPRYRYAAAVGLVLAATGLRLACLSPLGLRATFVTFFPAVIFAALYGGLGPGVLATFLSVLVADYFWIEPVYSLGPATIADALSEGAFVFSGVLISWITDVMRQAWSRAAAAEARAVAAVERERAAAAMRESEERFSAAFDQGSIPMTLTALDFRLIKVNPAFCRLLQYTEGELVGRTFSQITHPDDLPVNRQGIERVARGEAPTFRMEKRYIRKDGQVVWVDMSTAAVRDAKGTPLYIVTHLQDITERKRAEESLRQSESRFRSLFEYSLDATFLTAAEGTILAANPAACALFGLSEEELRRAGREGIVDRTDPRVAQAIEERGRTGKIKAEFYCRRKDGTRFLAEVQSVLFDREQGRAFVVMHDITERRRAEEALRQSEAELAAAQRLAQIGSWQWDIPSDTASWSEETYRIFEMPGSPLEGHRKSFVDLVIPEDRPRVDQALTDALSGQREYDLDYRIRLADGTEKVIHAQAEVVREDGEPVLMRGTVQDITLRKEVEEQLRRSEHQLSKAQEIARLGSWELDLAKNHLSWSDEVYRIFGLTPREFAATYEAFLAAVHPDDVEAVKQAYERSLRENRDTYQIEHRVVRKSDGQIRVVRERCEHIRDAGGRIVRSLGMVHDITEAKQAEDSLRQSETRFRAIFDKVGLGIIEAAMDDHFITANDEACRILGYSREELLRMNVHDLTHPEDRPRSDELNAALHAGRYDRLSYEKRYIRKDGSTLWAIVTVSAVRDAGGRWVRSIGTLQDITPRKQDEQALQEAKTNAEQARAEAEQANRAKDHFLAVLSHELRNPLSPVLATAAMLHEDLRFDAETREQLEVIHRNAELEARLIDDLLDVTRIARGKTVLNREPVEICEVLHRTVEVCKPDIESRNLQFNFEACRDGPYVIDGDAARLQQVFWNLLRNSIKFTPSGGSVEIRCRQDAGWAVVEVADTGAGIDAETLPKVFTPFEQGERGTTRQFGGLGLGLTISKAIVELHGGTIEARSGGRNKGAIFTVRLPVASGGLPAASSCSCRQAAAGSKPAPAIVPLRILLVEDHGDTARIMQQLLTRQGHSVQRAADVATALQLAGAPGSAPFDLLLSDLGLPDGSGIELMRTLRAKGLTLPGIAISGYGQEQDIQQSREAGFSVHLIKPVNMAQLSKAIAEVTRPLPATL